MRRPLIITIVAAAAAADNSDSCDASTLSAAAKSFRKDGYAVLPNFASAEEVASMLSSMEGMVASWWQNEQGSDADNVFTTGENQTKAQAASRYFFDSADRVHFFKEASQETTEGEGSGPPALNKVGHGLHLDSSTPFGAYATSSRISAAAREVAGLVTPVLPQSMYIFKPARVGGSVTSHQDGTFLYTTPHQTVVGFWLALHDATLENGCLWARPGSHLEPLRRRFVRSTDGSTDGGEEEVVMTFTNVSSADDESFLSDALLGGESLPAGQRAAALASGEAARQWEGKESEGAAELSARGFVPLPVNAGDLVMFPGTLDHLSLPNTSPNARHTFQLHMVESDGVEWASSNWLQYPQGKAFPHL